MSETHDKPDNWTRGTNERGEECWIITLKHPVTVGNEHTQLFMRDGKIKDLKGIKVGNEVLEMDHLVTIASRMCGVVPAVIHEIHGGDVVGILGEANRFLARCL